MIEQLLQSKKITSEEYEIYMLFRLNELGRKCLDKMLNDTYMDEPSEKEFGGVGFAFYDGRRSVFRDIRRVIISVEQRIKEEENDSN